MLNKSSLKAQDFASLHSTSNEEVIPVDHLNLKLPEEYSKRVIPMGEARMSGEGNVDLIMTGVKY